MSLPPESIDATHDIIYLAKHPLYEFALEKSAPMRPELRSQPSLVQLRFTGQPQQQGIKLPLAALEQFHDALGRRQLAVLCCLLLLPYLAGCASSPASLIKTEQPLTASRQPNSDQELFTSDGQTPTNLERLVVISK
jgi:hypothetical protein